MISRRGAGIAENFIVYFVLIPNAFTYFAPWRELIVFLLSPRRQGRQELLCLFYSYDKYLCDLCVSARLYLFFLAETQRKPMCVFFLTPNTFAYFAPWREFICFFLSQRRCARRELRRLIYPYPKHLCVLRALVRVNCFSLSQRRQELQCLFCSYPK